MIWLVIATAFLLIILGTYAWRILWSWEKIPVGIRNWLNRNICPDLNGIWQAELRSNWKIEEHGKLGDPINAEIEIKADWFFIRMILKTDYSHSHIIANKIEKNEEMGRFLLWYLYRNDTPRPLETDERQHQGAALLQVEWEDNEPVLIGHYWTDRKWLNGENTAGEIKLRRNKI